MNLTHKVNFDTQGQSWHLVHHNFIVFIMLGSKRTYGGGLSGRSGPSKYRKTSPSISGKILRLQRTVAALRPEVKQLQTVTTISNLAQATGNIAYISGVAQGTTDASRIGDTIRPKYLNVSQYFINPGATAGFYSTFVVLDKESNGVVPVISGTAQAVFSTFNNTEVFTNPSTEKRFKILKRFDVSSASHLSGAPGGSLVQHARIPLSGMMHFHDTSSAQTGAGKNALYLITITNDSTNVADFSLTSQLGFTDV